MGHPDGLSINRKEPVDEFRVEFQGATSYRVRFAAVGLLLPS
jgi:hypothetical protein